MDQWLSYVSEVGFPIVISFYLLHRIEVKLDVVIRTIKSLQNNSGDEFLPSKRSS
ncbi:YvrJ family protein [Cytobacillus sp. Hm23]|uniref:YvrJ family protein n=1 Tax=Cytobacillus sp. IB215665 TaxID=3097357 RepID=UPI002A12E26A|nr:YvrJ family protein [Cytobacillus sp. IB215665]MDX8366387.1 YvrJ family protein [Cytobacillus sp. IB215665]